jgi:hypothetical protein
MTRAKEHAMEGIVEAVHRSASHTLMEEKGISPIIGSVA